MTKSLFINGFILLACMGWLGLRGYDRGVIRTLQRVISLIAAYAACYIGMVPVADLIKAQLSWTLIPAYLLSAALCFFIIAFVVEYLIGLLVEEIENRGVEPAKITGACLGVALGALLGIITVWLGGLMLDAYRLQSPAFTQVEIQDPVRKLAGELVGDVVELTLSAQMEEGSLMPELSSQLLSNPVKLTQQVMQVSQSDAMRALFSDPQAQQLMLAHQTEALQNHPHFQTLMASPEAGEIFVLLSEKTASGKDIDPPEKVARLLSDMYLKVSRVQHDPRFLRLAEKPEFKQLAQNPSPVAMLANPALGELAEIIFNPAPPVSAEPATLQRLEPLAWEVSTSAEQPVVLEEETPAPEGLVMYRWTDGNGRKHYSETRPEEDYEVELVRLSP